MQQVFQQLLHNEFQDFKKGHLNVSLPLREHILNEVIQAAVLGGAIQQMNLEVYSGNRLKMFVVAQVKLLGMMNTNIDRTIMLKLKDTVAITDAFQEVAEVEGIEGGFGKIEQKLLQILSNMISQKLPEFALFKNNSLQINFSKLLVNSPYGFLSQYMDALAFSTERSSEGAVNKIWLNTKLTFQ